MSFQALCDDFTEASTSSTDTSSFLKTSDSPAVFGFYPNTAVYLPVSTSDPNFLSYDFYHATYKL